MLTGPVGCARDLLMRIGSDDHRSDLPAADRVDDDEAQHRDDREIRRRCDPAGGILITHIPGGVSTGGADICGFGGIRGRGTLTHSLTHHAVGVLAPPQPHHAR